MNDRVALIEGILDVRHASLENDRCECLGAPSAPDVRDRSRVRQSALTAHLERELGETVRTQARTLGLTFDTLEVEVSLAPAAEVLGSGSAAHPWIRYNVSIDSAASPAQVRELHRRIEGTWVLRLSHEYDKGVAGRVVNTRLVADRTDEQDQTR